MLISKRIYKYKVTLYLHTNLSYKCVPDKKYIHIAVWISNLYIPGGK